jgi:hypothetical protein
MKINFFSILIDKVTEEKESDPGLDWDPDP